MRGLVGDSTITRRVLPGMMAALTALQQAAEWRQRHNHTRASMHQTRLQPTKNYAPASYDLPCCAPAHVTQRAVSVQQRLT
jgi:type II secretory pathway component PulL